MLESLLSRSSLCLIVSLTIAGSITTNLALANNDGTETTQKHATKSQCEDHGSYPWGWNPITLESCRLDETPSTTCIDTGVKGDGWGWNGTESCTIALRENTYRCDDSGNYPWGWNPTKNVTCRQDLADITETVSYRISYLEIVDVQLACRKFQKQDSQGRNILLNDHNEFYFAALQSFNEPNRGAELFTFNVSYNGPNNRIVFAPTQETTTDFLYGVNSDGSRNNGLFRVDQLENGSFNISERDPYTLGAMTSRCVYR